jgi:DNA mismatch endonuclease, patch repair protein
MDGVAQIVELRLMPLSEAYLLARQRLKRADSRFQRKIWVAVSRGAWRASEVPTGNLSPEARSRVMQSIRKANTLPEMAVRRIIHGLGFRYRLHARELPGTPDIVLPRLRKVIMIHGCFWHQHAGCRLAKLPRSRPEYWLPKLGRNQERDEIAQKALTVLGWSVLVIWECQIDNADQLRSKLSGFLSAGNAQEPNTSSRATAP